MSETADLPAKPALRLTATSYLMPGARAWKPFCGRYGIDFGAYGDWPDALITTSGDLPLAWLIFLDDLVAESALDGADDTALYDAIASPLLSLLDARLDHAAAPTIVGWMAPRSPPAVAAARRHPVATAFAQRFEAALFDLAERRPGLHLFSLDDAIADIGRARALDTRNQYAVRCRLSAEGVGAIATVLGQVLDRFARPACKVLVLDCDNTLWGGVVGEDGVDGLRLGQDGDGAAFVDFQRVAKRLASQGLVLALASKNNEPDVWQVFDTHSAMVLTRELISAWRIDWAEKSDNLAAIADELGVGLSSIAFWDDNPLEREKVRAAAPQVAVLEVSPAVVDWPRDLARAPQFAKFDVTSDDRSKANQYQARGAFVREISDRQDRSTFLRSINLQPKLLPLGPPTLARAAQLCAKTNQFNVRTARHTAPELTAIAAEPGLHSLVSLEDRFGDHGVVGLVLARVTPSNPRVAFLDTFLMSCRVLGRELDAWMLNAVVERLRAAGVHSLVAEYISTDKNPIVANLFIDRGFTPIEALEKQPAEELHRATAPWSPTGALFVADIHTIKVPGLEIYQSATTPE